VTGLPCPCGRYELLERIGFGGMAEVFRARLSGPAGFEKIVVVKRILPGRADDANAIQMFLEEAKIAAAVDHDNVAQVFELGQAQDGGYFMAMEHIAGVDLERLLVAAAKRSLRVPPWFAVYVICEVLEALEYVHGLMDAAGRPLNVIHRDATPSNIFVSRLGRVKLGDFGVANFAGKSTTTRAGQLKGKLSYMSPEQLGGKVLDRRSDLFTVGVGLWECLTQRRLFAGHDVQVMMAICESERKRPSAIAPGIPETLDRVALKSLAIDREERYRSASEMQSDLLAILDHMQPARRRDVRRMYEILLGRMPPSAETTSGPLPVAGSKENSFLTKRNRPASAQVREDDAATVDEADQPELAAEVSALRAVLPDDALSALGVKKLKIEPAVTKLARPPPPAATEPSPPARWGASTSECERALGRMFSAVARGESTPITLDGGAWIDARDLCRLLGCEIDPDFSAPSNLTVVGSVAERSIVAAFGILARDRYTGTLSVARSEASTEDWYEIDVSAGRPTRVVTNVQAMQLPYLLVDLGLLAPSDLAAAVQRVIVERRPLDAVVEEATGKRIERAWLMCARLGALFSWRSAEYTFSIDVARVFAHGPFCRSLLTPLPALVERAFGAEELEARLARFADEPHETSWRYDDAINEMDLRADQRAAMEQLRSSSSLSACLRSASPDARGTLLAMAYLLREADLLLDRIE
jgi:serine/threonine-protein kinase